MSNNISGLPENISNILNNFVEHSIKNFNSNLVSIVLFGSAAEGQLRRSSDVNILLILNKFEVDEANTIRDILRNSFASIQLKVMFLLESEINQASDLFAIKFMDMTTRNKILYGINPFANLQISREKSIQRLQQIVLNLTIRLREKYVLQSLREEQLISILAEMSAPIRSCALTILKLQDIPVSSPKEALIKFVEQLSMKSDILTKISNAREGKSFKSGESVLAIIELMSLLDKMKKIANELV